MAPVPRSNVSDDLVWLITRMFAIRTPAPPRETEEKIGVYARVESLIIAIALQDPIMLSTSSSRTAVVRSSLVTP